MIDALLDRIRTALPTVEGTPAPRRAVAYARVSTEMQAQQNLSIPEQVYQIEQYAAREGIEVVETFRDEGYSAYNDPGRRPGMMELLNRVFWDSTINVLIVSDYTRFARDDAWAEVALAQLRSRDVQFIAVANPEFNADTPGAELLQGFTKHKAKQYSAELSRNTKNSARRNMHTRDPQTGWGQSSGGRPPFGYRVERRERGYRRPGVANIKSTWVPNEEVVAGRPVCDWARDCLLMARDGKSLGAICDYLNDHGVPAPEKQFWAPGTWHSLLQPWAVLKYAGHMVWNVHAKHGRVRPVDDWEIEENAMAPIITQEDAEAILQLRQAGRRERLDFQNPRRKTSTYLASGGLFTCAACGEPMVGSSNGSKTRRRYRCKSHESYGGRGCVALVLLDRDETDLGILELVGEQLIALAKTPSFADLAVASFLQRWDARTGHDQVKARELARVRKELTNLRGALRDDVDDRAYLKAEIAALRRRESELAQVLPEVSTPPPHTAADLRAVAGRIGDLLRYASPEKLRELVRMLVRHMEIDPRTSPPTIRVEFAFSTDREQCAAGDRAA